MAGKVRAFQIFYNDRTRASLDPDFEPLDNSKNERPDWYEYWPIRTFLSENRLNDSTYYGFLSPLFFQKTGLTGKKVMDFLRQPGDADIVTFSPFPCHAAVFVNVFEQGEFFHQGLYDVAPSDRMPRSGRELPKRRAAGAIRSLALLLEDWLPAFSGQPSHGVPNLTDGWRVQEVIDGARRSSAGEGWVTLH